MLRRLNDQLHMTVAEFKTVPPSANGNGQVGVNTPEYGRAAHHGGNGHRRVRHQIHKGFRRAALKADTAVRLVEAGMSVGEAVTRMGVSTNAYSALKAVRASGNLALYEDVLRGSESTLPAAARVKNAATIIAAYKKCSALEKELIRSATGLTSDPVTMLMNLTPEQLVAVAKALGLDWVWDKMIAAAMPTEPATGTKETVLADPAIRDVT